MKKEIKIYPVDLNGKKSEVALSSKGAKHYHSTTMFSFLPKGEVKRVVKAGGAEIEGYLSDDYGGERFRHFFSLGHYPKGSVRVGCLIFSRSQWGRVKEWLFSPSSTSLSTPSTKTKVKGKGK